MLTSKQIASNDQLTEDYGIGRGPSHPNPDAVFARIERRAELLRLQQIVIDKAKLWAAAILKGAYAQIKADDELRDAELSGFWFPVGFVSFHT